MREENEEIEQRTIRDLFPSSGFLFEDSPDDTTNLVCARGHIYLDGELLVAAIEAATPAESRKLRDLGTVVMDGDFGELSVSFPAGVFREVARIMRPRQAGNRKRAA